MEQQGIVEVKVFKGKTYTRIRPFSWDAFKDKNNMAPIGHDGQTIFGPSDDNPPRVWLDEYSGKIPLIKIKKSNMKVACSGSSGSGKTTLVTYIAEQTGLEHISGSAGDVKQEGDKMIIDDLLGYPGGGHHGVIAFGALNHTYGIMNQQLLQMRRQEIITQNDNFITDRSPADNMTYFINQCGYFPEVSDAMCQQFFNKCLEAWCELTHVIYVKAVQPQSVEFNGSRIANKFYQQAVDVQFEYWINRLQKASISGPEVMIIDYWDLDQRKENVMNFIN